MTQLVVTIEDQSVLPHVRNAIRQLRGVARVATLKNLSKQASIKANEGKLHSEMNSRLDELSQLKAGWDGVGSQAISGECILKFRNALEVIPEKLLKGWVLFPDARGHLYLDYTENGNVAGITLTDSQLIYFMKKGSLVEKNEGIGNSSSNLLSILEKVYG